MVSLRLATVWNDILHLCISLFFAIPFPQGVFGLIGSFTRASSLTANCPSTALTGGISAAQVPPRLLFGPLFEDSVVGTLLAIWTVYHFAGNVESLHGTLFFLNLLILLSVTTNVLFFVVVYGLFDNPSLSSPSPSSSLPLPRHLQILLADWCLSGPWPVLFGIISFETTAAGPHKRSLMFCPFRIPAQVFPFVLFALYCLFMWSIRPEAFLGLCVGYLCMYAVIAAVIAVFFCTYTIFFLWVPSRMLASTFSPPCLPKRSLLQMRSRRASGSPLRGSDSLSPRLSARASPPFPPSSTLMPRNAASPTALSRPAVQGSHQPLAVATFTARASA